MNDTRKIGYARVSTTDQNLDLQAAALMACGCEVIFRDEGLSGASSCRPGLNEAISALSAGDTLVVWKLDRLGRSLRHLVDVLDDLGRRGIGFVSLTEAIDTTTPSGRLLFHLLAALAEFERCLIAERTRAGMAVARSRGASLGRPPKLSTLQLSEVRRAIASNEADVPALAKRYCVSESTIRRAIHCRSVAPP